MNFTLISLAFILMSLLIVAVVVTKEVHRVWMFSGYMKRVKEDKKSNHLPSELCGCGCQ